MNDIGPAIVIAAGGEGTRIGGDKPARLLAGKPLIEHALDWAKKQADLVAVAVRQPDQCTLDNVPILIDAIPGIGPISALQSAFRFAEENDCDAVLLIGCDQPFLPNDLVSRLASEIGSSACAMAHSEDRAHPLVALWRIDRATLHEYISSGARSLWRFAELVGCTKVHWRGSDSSEIFTNINDEIALAEAERRLRKQAQ
ncbi:molybdenum cofactor guanylyltransferase [Qipengyuania gaetbuli]|uniref:molybdenum cofactor guanylyltransferase n=1 Tax=Qipengyuania gaetbuli TaxID=266952 RepID=UPI001CFD6C08|nr:molybdenum cofactor guanylyltransferase [Qipengyuania gaetbuli]